MEKMDLRDEFACRALSMAMEHQFSLGLKNPRIIASNAYTIAEAMIEAREKADRMERIEWALRWEKEGQNVF